MTKASQIHAMSKPRATKGRANKSAGDGVKWAAVAARDRAMNGQFVYAVTTTGVYCRPGCAARRARRENVRFFDAPDEAERAGFRPCKRCRPDRGAGDEGLAAKIAAACRKIETSESEPTLASLARGAGLSPHHFHRLFKSATGVTPKAYALTLRQRAVRKSLTRSQDVTTAIFDAGYSSSGRFYETSSKVLGMTPKAYRNGGADADIRFAVGECSLGAILVAATAKGVCAILLGDDAGALIKELEDTFPKARLTGADKDFERVVATVVGHVDHPRTRFTLPLDIRGTAFQHRVWQELQKIPAGETASYSQIAERIGAPKAVRAVASACAANTLAVAIPCHRVVRTNGALSGYRWGIARKDQLLRAERAGRKL